MTSTELDIFQTALSSKHAELVRALDRRDGIAIVRTADVLDEVQFASERELSTRRLDRGSTVLRDVRAALDRIADGTYGACAECEAAIGKKRLLAVPWAALCVACQERADSPVGRHPEKLLRDAA